MKNYSTKILFLLSLTLLTNQANAGKDAKHKTNYRTKPYKITIEKNKKKIARKIVRKNYLHQLNCPDSIRLSNNLAQKIQHLSKEIQDAVWLEYTALMTAFSESNVAVIIEILGQEIYDRLEESQEKLLQIQKDAKSGDLNAQKLLLLIIEIPQLIQQLYQQSESTMPQFEKLSPLVSEKLSTLIQIVSSTEEQSKSNYIPLVNLFEYIIDILKQILGNPEEAETFLNQLCSSLDLVQI